MSKRVLVLEDDNNMRDLLVFALEDEGYQVIGSHSAAQAINMVDKYEFDVIITDIRMANMDGLSCLKVLKQTHPALLSIVMTGCSGPDSLHRALALQVDDYLYKPFELCQLQESVRRVLGREVERCQYQGLVDSLISKCQSFIKNIRQARSRAQQKRLDIQRDGLFQAYYVGVRTRGLTISTALKVWDQLEVLEAAFHNLADETGDANRLSEVYHDTTDYVIALGQAGHLEPAGKRTPEQLSREQFTALFMRLRDGELSCEQLRIAPLLRFYHRLSPALMSQAMRCNYEMIWGHARASEHQVWPWADPGTELACSAPSASLLWEQVCVRGGERQASSVRH